MRGHYRFQFTLPLAPDYCCFSASWSARLWSTPSQLRIGALTMVGLTDLHTAVQRAQRHFGGVFYLPLSVIVPACHALSPILSANAGECPPIVVVGCFLHAPSGTHSGLWLPLVGSCWCVHSLYLPPLAVKIHLVCFARAPTLVLARAALLRRHCWSWAASPSCDLVGALGDM